jgi:PKD repeat protein
MADQESGGKKSGWFKTFVGTLAGLCSGAAVMYLTPLVNRVIQPAKPVANFSVEHDGLTVRVQDLSNVHQGHWDFGDGTPLVPVSSDDMLLSHTFPGPGEYTIKLSLQNILNEENERSVVVKLDGGTAAAAAPAAPHVANFQAVAVGSSTYAPASFRLTAETQNAEMCVLDMGDGRKEIMKHPAASSERVVTFDKPGHFVVKLVAVNGTQHEEKQAEVVVMAPPAGVAMAVLTVNDTGTHVDSGVKQVYLNVPFPRDQRGNSYAFTDRCVAAASINSSVSEVHVSFKGKEVKGDGKSELDLTPLGLKTGRNLKLKVSPDRKSVLLSGELLRENNGAAPSLVIPAVVVEQHETDAALSTCYATEALGLPGSGLPSVKVLSFPAPAAGITNPRRTLAGVQLRDANNVLWHTEQLPAAGYANVQGQTVLVSATKLNDRQVQIQLSPATPSTGPRTGRAD